MLPLYLHINQKSDYDDDDDLLIFFFLSLCNWHVYCNYYFCKHLILGERSAQLKKFYCKLVSVFNLSSVRRMAEHKHLMKSCRGESYYHISFSERTRLYS